MTRFLTTAAGGTLAPLNIRLLQRGARLPAWVLAVDARPDAVGRHMADAFAVVPSGAAPNYVDAIVDLVRQYGIQVVMPWSDEEALALAAQRERVEAAGAVLACAPYQTLLTMSDKAASLRALAAAGIRTPSWAIAEDRDTLDRLLTERRAATGEAVVKPLVSRGARGVFVIRDDIKGSLEFPGSREVHADWPTFDREFRASVDCHLPVVVMERLHAPAYDIDVLGWQGKVLRAVPRERVNPAGIPFQGSYFRFDPRLLALAEAVTRAFSLSWLYDYDLMTTSDGEPVVIEINPRPSGSIAAAIAAGVPFYEDLIELAQGRMPAVTGPLPPDGQLVVPYLDCHVVAKSA